MNRHLDKRCCTKIVRHFQKYLMSLPQMYGLSLGISMITIQDGCEEKLLLFVTWANSTDILMTGLRTAIKG
jgi:hypothetical protein